RNGRALPAPGRRLLALPDRGRTPRLAAVVRAHEAARRAGHPGGSPGAGADRTPAVAQNLLLVAPEHSRLVYLTPALVGTPAPRVVLRRRGDHPRLARRPDRVSPVPRTASARPRCPRHLVLLPALAILDSRMAAGDARAQDLLPDSVPRHRLRHPVLLGGADDHDRSA